MEDKKIEICELSVRDIKTTFGNPRKIKKVEIEKLKKSFELFGDFGIFIINEKNELIAGNQRFNVIKTYFPDKKLLCKKLIGYSNSELRAINIKDNTHSGEWDLDLLADWTADLNLDIDIDVTKKPLEKIKAKDMELLRYEKYDYVIIACKNEVDYNRLTEVLGLKDRKILIAGKRRIKARAIWYDDMKCKIARKDEDENEVKF